MKFQDEFFLEVAARACHEVNRSYCIALGDISQPSWEDAPEWQKVSAKKGVYGVIEDGYTPERSHQSWLAEKQANGWKYGPVKDPVKKEHPCFLPFAELPHEMRMKDVIFVRTATMMCGLLMPLDEKRAAAKIAAEAEPPKPNTPDAIKAKINAMMDRG